MIDLSGPEAVPARRFRKPAKAASVLAAAAKAVSRILSLQPDGSVSIAATNGGVTIAISSPSSSASSASAALQASLASRLRARMDGYGSMLFALSWIDVDMPSGPPICRLRASVLRTSDSDLASWPTPTSALADKGVRSTQGGIREAKRSRGPDLAAMACLSSWPTPTTRDHKDGSSEGTAPINALLGRAVWLAGWPTPQSRDGMNSRSGQIERTGGQRRNLDDYVMLASGPARFTAAGEMLTGSSAGMAGGGQLSPAHSRWLMGYPAAWDDCAPTATRSSRRSGPSSSAHISTSAGASS